jgi:hypothetical protein
LALPKYEYCRYRKILRNTGYTSIADTGRFWKVLVIPVLQILEDSRKYWLYQSGCFTISAKIIHAVKFGTNNTKLFESRCFQQRVCNFPP